MRFEPSPEVWLAWIGEDLVALSLQQGQYYCLPNFADVASARADGALEVSAVEAVQDLVDAGLIRPVGATARRRPRWTPPRADLSELSGAAPGARARADMARAFLVMVRRYYGRSLKDIVATAQRMRPPLPSADAPALGGRTADFAALLPWTPFQGECLFRAFMLLAFLRMAGFDADWVFGVRTWPFQAHCWLQAGEVVLDDHLERVAPFTPILVV
jgi:hypothetical protein